jgi:primary-amine oxidase
MFVTPWKEDQLYPSDIHINQHPGAEKFGLQEWVEEDGVVNNTDIVCWPCKLSASSFSDT